MVDIENIRRLLVKEGEEGWLFYNFRDLDPCANFILQMSPAAVRTRRWFYLIPARGTPVKLVHRIESGALDHLPGDKLEYATWKDLHGGLRKMLASAPKVCMQYSPGNAIPYISYVDGGTLELVRSAGGEVRSSADLVQHLEAVWGDEDLESHLKAAQNLWDVVRAAFSCTRGRVAAISEYELQQFILEKFREMDMVCDHPPIVAVNEHSGDPHYEPSAQHSSPIRKGDFLLIDLWAKREGGIYADITWVAMVDERVPEGHAAVFAVVKNARDAAVRFIERRLAERKEICGYEVDDACRKVIEDAGYGPHFIHRTGHNIGREAHGKGVNIDNFETRDERKLIDGIGFSIEPGVYLPGFGIRSEINVYLKAGKAHVSTLPVQNQIVPLLAADFAIR